MKRFTVILFAFSLLLSSVSHGIEIFICTSSNETSPQWAEFLEGLKLKLEQSSIPYHITDNCTQPETLSLENETVSFYSLLPTTKEEVDKIMSLIEGENIALIYKQNWNEVAYNLLEKLQKENKKIVFEYEYGLNKTDYRKIIDLLVELKQNRVNIDSLIFIGNYKEATFFVPFFRIFSPSPKVVGTWRISSTLMFPFRKFMDKLIFYDWYLPFQPIINIRGFNLLFKEKYNKLPNRFSFLGYEAGKYIAEHKTLPTKIIKEYETIRLKELPRLAPYCRF